MAAGPGLQLGGRVVDAGALEVGPAVQWQPAVARPGGQHDRAGEHLGAVAQHQPQLGAAGVQLDDLARAGQLGAELERLQGGPLGQLGPGQPGREAEVVLDPGAGRGLPAGAHGVQQHRPQALRGAVDRGGQPGRTRTDDGEVDRVAGQRPVGQAQDVGELAGGRPAQHPPADDDGGQVVGGQRGGGHQRLAGDRLGVEPQVRDPLPRRVGAQRVRPGRQLRADDLHRAGGDAGAQRLAAGHQGAQQDVGEVGVLGHQPAEPGRRHPVHPAGLHHPRDHVDDLAGEQVELAEEAARPVLGDRGLRLVAGRRAGDLHPAGLQDDQVVSGVAGGEDHVAGDDLARVAVGGEPAELVGGELGRGGGAGRRHGGVSLGAGPGGTSADHVPGPRRQGRLSRRTGGRPRRGARPARRGPRRSPAGAARWAPPPSGA
ncbi:unannotated protein [freshwater metagenome]|uniref:Unannotated protein n=1 Tax=freshwater metagenome TaxID=449393 RepID=A0A6J7HMF0_9ZZZZ